MFNPFKKKKDLTYEALSQILANPGLMEDFLGVKPVDIPTADKIRQDAYKLYSHTNTPEYQVFAKEVWARALSHLDLVLDAKTPSDKLAYHRGALSATLDLLRISYQAKQLIADQKKPQSAPSVR